MNIWDKPYMEHGPTITTTANTQLADGTDVPVRGVDLAMLQRLVDVVGVERANAMLTGEPLSAPPSAPTRIPTRNELPRISDIPKYRRRPAVGGPSTSVAIPCL